MMNRSASHATPPRPSPGRSRRRPLGWILPAVVAVSAAGLVLAVAALINVSSPTLGSNTVVTAGCDKDTMTATPIVSFSATTGGYVVDSVLLEGLHNECRNNDYNVALVGSGGLLATSTRSDVPNTAFTGTNQAWTLSLDFTGASPRVSADQVTAIHVAITN